MIKGIRIYVEGGGDRRSGKHNLRLGLSEFLKDVTRKARDKNLFWNIIACGSRQKTYKSFCDALRDHPDSFNILLVDSEASVNGQPWEHLKQRKGDGWENPGVSDDHCHLMVQFMESWFLADVEALKTFYGNNFQDSALPNNKNVEGISKKDVLSALEKATTRTQRGKYHKGRHTHKLLAVIDPDKVRKRALHCERLFTTLAATIG